MEVATSRVLVLPYTASSVGVARRRLIGDLTAAGVYESMACDAGLVLSELISNALRHATPLPGSTVKVSWKLRAGIVEVAVSDGGGQTEPRMREASASSVGGRGLGIVARLSLRWGVCAADGAASGGEAGESGEDHTDHEADTIPGGSTVWAELPVQYGNVPALVIASSRDA